MSGGVSGGGLRSAEGGSGPPNGATRAPNGGASTRGVVRAAAGITKEEADVWYVNVEGDEMRGTLAMRLPGDASPRFGLSVDGGMAWGPGSTGPLVTLLRQDAALLVNGRALEPSPAAGNTVQWDGAGLYVPPAAVPPEYLTEAEADARFLTPSEGDARYLPLSARAHDHTAADGSGALTNEQHDGYSQYANLGADPAQPGTNTIRLYSKDNGSGVATLYYRTEDGTVYELPTLTSGGGGSGAPANATYVTTAAEGKLTGERVLGTAVVMTGPLASRPAAGTAGRLYLAADNDLAYRDNGSAWDVFATRHGQTHALFSPDHPDVDAADAPADGQVLTYAAAAGKWVAAPGGGGGGGGLPTTGGTMTGPIASQGAAADAGGALAVTSPAAPPTTDSLVYGAAAAGWSPLATGTGSQELGIRFACTAAQYLVAVRWYRRSTAVAPLSLRLWDTAAPATPVWSYGGTPTEFGDAATGWKEYRLPAGTQPLLVAGRQYALSFTASSSTNQARQTSFTPAPDPGITFSSHVANATPGGYPATTGTTAFAIDGGFRTTVAAPNPAGSGAVRLPNGVAGAVGWRNAANTADLTLATDAGDRLAYSGTTLQLGGDATLTRPSAGALQTNGNLGIGVAPPAWGSGIRAVQVAGVGSVLSGVGTTGFEAQYVAVNTYFDGTSWRAMGSGPGAASYLQLQQSGLTFANAPSAAAGAAQTFTTRLQVAQTGTVTVTPDAGQQAIHYDIPSTPGPASGFVAAGVAGGTNLRLAASAGLELDAGGNFVVPARQNAIRLGDPSVYWSAIYVQGGVVQPSAADVKTDITPLDPAAALAAVLATDPVVFDYQPPERDASWYELPDDPEQAETVLRQRLTAAPLEAGARHQAGFVLDDPTGTYATAPAFATGSGQSNAANTAGILLGALHEVVRRLTALEEPQP